VGARRQPAECPPTRVLQILRAFAVVSHESKRWVAVASARGPAARRLDGLRRIPVWIGPLSDTKLDRNDTPIGGQYILGMAVGRVRGCLEAWSGQRRSHVDLGGRGFRAVGWLWGRAGGRCSEVRGKGAVEGKKENRRRGASRGGKEKKKNRI